jgi:hypothetical protein
VVQKRKKKKMKEKCKMKDKLVILVEANEKQACHP